MTKKISNEAKKFILLATSLLALAAVVLLLKFSPSGTALLWSMSSEGKWLLPLVAVAALLDSVNPCAFSVLLVTIAFLLNIGKARSQIFAIGGTYILGIFAVYILIGLGILQTLHLFNTPHFMAKAGALLLVALGAINVLGELFPAFPVRIRIPNAVHRPMARLLEQASLPAAFVLGGLVGLCEFPCTGGPYLMVLGLLHDSSTYLRGLWYLLFYNLIFVLPLVLILALASNRALQERAQKWQQKERGLMRLGGCIARIFLGIIIFLL